MREIGKSEQPLNLTGDTGPVLRNDYQQSSVAALRDDKQIAYSGVQGNVCCWKVEPIFPALNVALDSSALSSVIPCKDGILHDRVVILVGEIEQTSVISHLVIGFAKNCS